MKFLDPCVDVAFKKIFGSEEHKGVTIAFLNSILEYTGKAEITDVQFLNTEQKRILRDKKDNILDILCTDQNNKKYLVEIQVEGVKGFGKRIVFYGAKTYALQLGKAKPYRSLEPVVAVSILDFILFPNKKDYKSIHLLLDKKTYEHDLQELSFAFVELPKFKKQAHEIITNEDKWIYFLKEISQQDHIPDALNEKEFIEACNAANKMTWTDEELNDYDDALVRATDLEGSIEIASEKGRIEGKIEGKIEEKNMTALMMLKKGFDLSIIADITGLSIDQIKDIK